MKRKLLFLAVLVVLTISNVMAQCDPWITKAYQELYGRGPSATDCNIRNYNNGSWNNYNELVTYIKNYNASKTTSTVSNCDAWIIKAYQELYRRNPSATECNIRNYNNGSWNNYNELVTYIKTYNTPKSTTTTPATQSCDPWIAKAYQELYKRTPSTAECNTRNYNNGSWSSYNDLVTYIRNYNNKPGSSTTGNSNIVIKGKSTLKGDAWIFKAYREIYKREPNAGELNIKNYNNGSWSSYEDLKNYIRQFQTNLTKNKIAILTKDLGTGYLLVGYTNNSKFTAMNLVDANGGNVVAAGGLNLISPSGGWVVAAGGLNLRDVIASFIKENGGMVIAPGGGNILNMNNAGLSASQIMSGIQNMAGAGFGGSYRVASAGEAIIPASGKSSLIFK